MPAPSVNVNDMCVCVCVSSSGKQEHIYAQCTFCVHSIFENKLRTFYRVCVRASERVSGDFDLNTVVLCVCL